MNDSIPTLTLLNRQFASRFARLYYWAYLAFVLLSPFLLVYILTENVFSKKLNKIDFQFYDVLVLIWDKCDTTGLIQLLVAVLCLVCLLFYVELSWRRERLVLSADGIRYVSLLPGGLNVFKRDWYLKWNEIQSIAAEQPDMTYNADLSKLVFETNSGTYKINPLRWIDQSNLNSGNTIKPFKHWLGNGRGTVFFINNQLDQCDVIQFIRKYREQLKLPGTDDDLHVQKLQQSFPLESNPYSFGICILFFALVMYALVDFALSDQAYIDDSMHTVFPVLGVAAFSLFLYLQISNGVPALESTFVSALTGIAFACALYSGLLRINQLTDIDGVQSYQYQMIGYSVFDPVDETLPRVRLTRYLKYWSQFEPGSIHTFYFSRGVLGFWQINLKTIREDATEYYEASRNH